MSGDDFPSLLTPGAAAARLGMCTRQLLALVGDGAIRYIDVGRGRVRIRRMFDPADLAAYVEQQRRVVLPLPAKGGRGRQGHRIDERKKVVVECPSRKGRARPTGTPDSRSEVIAFSEVLERAAAARRNR